MISGVTGVASSFSWIEPLRPYLVGITILVLGFAWYQKLKPRKVIECDCETDNKSKFIQSRLFLGLVTGFAILMLLFPYYSEGFFPDGNKDGAIVSYENIAVINLNIEGMTCHACNYTVQNASLDLPGVFEAIADYKTGEATIKYDKSRVSPTDIINSVNKTEYKVTQKEK